MKPLIVVESRRQDGELGLRPSFPGLDLGRCDSEPPKQFRGARGEPVVHDVDVADGVAVNHEREADMPVGLGAGAVDGDGADVDAVGEEAGGGEGCAKGSQGAGVDDARECAVRGEEVQHAGGRDCLYAWVCGNVRGGEGDNLR